MGDGYIPDFLRLHKNIKKANSFRGGPFLIEGGEEKKNKMRKRDKKAAVIIMCV